MIEKIMTTLEKKVNSKAEIKSVIDDFMAALCLKDVKRMMSHYAADVIVYDVKPPFQVNGAIAWKHVWEACISYFPNSFKVLIKDLRIHVSGDLAISHYLFRLKGPEKDHAAMQTWIRTTTGFKRIQGNGRSFMSMVLCLLIHTQRKQYLHWNLNRGVKNIFDRCCL